jgi:putative oxidoreductase
MAQLGDRNGRELPLKGLGLAVLRLALAAVFIAHGANKLFGAFSGPGIGPGGLSNTAAFIASMGLKPAFPLAVLLGLTELGGGLLLIIGWFTRWVSIALIISNGIAIWKVHMASGFFLNWMGVAAVGQGMEFSVVLIAALACFVLGGAGDLSIDGRNELSSARRAAGRARLRGKV